MPEINQEITNRIKLSVYAYAYEYESTSLVSDEEYDSLSYQIKPEVSTGNRKLDNFFKARFDPSTGMWIRQHPELDKVKSIYERFYKGRNY